MFLVFVKIHSHCGRSLLLVLHSRPVYPMIQITHSCLNIPFSSSTTIT